MNKFYVTTSIPYVNGAPHLGHALEYVYADVLARYYKKQDDTEVLFATGSDEHGTKIEEKAKEAKLSPLDFTSKNVKLFEELLKLLNISYDRFIRTTDRDHEKRVRAIWKDLDQYIYKSKYIGMYCVGHEEFVTEVFAEENNGICPDHNRPYEKLEEENYFFSLGKLANEIKSAVENDVISILPTTRKNEILMLLSEGCDDLSISRPKEKLSWGIPVPGDTKHVIYVWFEALLNYITVLGYPDGSDFKKFWPADVQIIGKDVLRFHGLIWPGILLALNLELPKILYVHGHVNVDGKKMGKSLGNAIAPSEIVDKYGVDAYRYYFMRHIPSYSDGDFSWKRIEEVYNNELANELGNAVGRVAAMIVRYQEGAVGEIPDSNHDMHQYDLALQSCRFDKALDSVWEQVRGINQYIDTEKPWQLAKDESEKEHLREVLAYAVSCLLEIADLLSPFMPDTSKKIENLFSQKIVVPLDNPLFPKE